MFAMTSPVGEQVRAAFVKFQYVYLRKPHTLFRPDGVFSMVVILAQVLLGSGWLSQVIELRCAQRASSLPSIASKSLLSPPHSSHWGWAERRHSQNPDNVQFVRRPSGKFHLALCLCIFKPNQRGQVRHPDVMIDGVDWRAPSGK